MGTTLHLLSHTPGSTTLTLHKNTIQKSFPSSLSGSADDASSRGWRRAKHPALQLLTPCYPLRAHTLWSRSILGPPCSFFFYTYSTLLCPFFFYFFFSDFWSTFSFLYNSFSLRVNKRPLGLAIMVSFCPSYCSSALGWIVRVSLITVFKELPTCLNFFLHLLLFPKGFHQPVLSLLHFAL